MSERDAIVFILAVTLAADMSICLLTNPRAASRRDSSRRRAVTTSRSRSTTAHLLQALHVRNVLGPPGCHLQRDQSLAGDDPDHSALEGCLQPSRPHRFD